MRRIGARSAVLLLVLFCAACGLRGQAPEGPIAPKPGQPVQQTPPEAKTKLRVRVALVNTPVTVRDAKGEMVHDLDAKDFRVTDNGVEQKISHFDLGGEPLSLVILMETSSRIAPIFPEIQKTGILLTQTVMGPSGEAAIVSFNDGIDKLQDFTTNGDLIENTVTHLMAGTSGSKLYDAMAVGVEMLTGRPQATAEKPGRRRVLLILSEAMDDGSAANLGEVLRQAQLANVTIYSVGLSTTRAELQAPPKDNRPQISPPGTFPQPPMPGTVQTPTTEAARYGYGNVMDAVAWLVSHVKDQVKGNPLEIATAGTGGAHVATFKDRSIEKAIDEIGGELHSQYTIGYSPTGTDAAGYHEIKVQVDRKDLKVRARPGYYIRPPEG
jgi:VWFA-related protein